MPVRSRRRTLRQEMSRELRKHEREPTLRSPGSKDSCTCHTIHTIFMVRDVEGLRRVFAEALPAVPGQILQGSKCAVGEEDKVESAVADNNIIGMFDDSLQRSAVETGRRRSI